MLKVMDAITPSTEIYQPSFESNIHFSKCVYTLTCCAHERDGARTKLHILHANNLSRRVCARSALESQGSTPVVEFTPALSPNAELVHDTWALGTEKKLSHRPLAPLASPAVLHRRLA